LLSACCSHLVVDLAAGKVVESRLQCGFHRWEFDADGWCERIRLGEPQAKTAYLYRSRSVERFGLVWALNVAGP